LHEPVVGKEKRLASARRQPFAFDEGTTVRLPVASAVGSTAAVGFTAASAVKATSSAGCASTVEVTTAGSRIAVEAAVEFARSRTAESGSTPDAGPPVRTVPVKAMEPRASADKHAAAKILRTVVTIRRASVGSEPIVAIGADWSGADVERPNLNRDLRVGAAHRESKDSE
jgi:hypothetical protein